MISSPVYVLVQPKIRGSYWTSNILEGINNAATKHRDTLCILDTPYTDSFYGMPVLVVGSDIDWIDYNINMLTEYGVVPILVNACMLPIHRSICSGVVFELEEAMKYCVEYLKQTGHTRTAFLAPHANSVSDITKCQAFGDEKNTYPASSTIEECVDSFLKILPEKKYNGVICSNDTVAVCLINKMRKAGYSIPDDCYIIGMGHSFLAANHTVSISSVAFNYTQMGEQAVNLYHIIEKEVSPCHYTLSLPCCFVPGLSTGETSPMDYSSHVKKAQLTGQAVTDDTYFSGEMSQQIISLEEAFQRCDSTDRTIMFGLMNGDGIEEIAGRVFLTPRAVRYRIKNFFNRYTNMSQNEFLQKLRDILK